MKKLIAIVGATASGKTALAIQKAQEYNTEILSFDSRQCYKELKIGVARPNDEELAEVPHHFIATHSIHEVVNAAVYEDYALQTLEILFRKYDTVIAVGGTGLYLNALMYGLNEIPPINEALRTKLRKEFDEKGIDWLQSTLQQYDKSYTEPNDLMNSQRMLRALEVVMQTGNTIKYYHNLPRPKRSFTVEIINHEIDRAELYQRINERVDAMMNKGQLEEAKRLYAFKHLNALQTVGYSELFDYLDGKTDLDTAIQLIKQHTRNYAKRQLTWFRKQHA